MEDAYQTGSLHAIGVSNFEAEGIENLVKHAAIKPMVNQIRVHIGHTSQRLINYCQEHNILIMAFSPNATGKLLIDFTISDEDMKQLLELEEELSII